MRTRLEAERALEAKTLQRAFAVARDDLILRDRMPLPAVIESLGEEGLGQSVAAHIKGDALVHLLYASTAGQVAVQATWVSQMLAKVPEDQLAATRLFISYYTEALCSPPPKPLQPPLKASNHPTRNTCYNSTPLR